MFDDNLIVLFIGIYNLTAMMKAY